MIARRAGEVARLWTALLVLASGAAHAADEPAGTGDSAEGAVAEEAVDDVVEAEVPVPPRLQQSTEPTASDESIGGEELLAPEEAGEPDTRPTREAPPAPAEAVVEEEPAAAAKPEPESKPEPEVPGQWAPPLPSAKEFDWLQVKSGEWLKGEFKTLRDYRVSFDSDEFDDIDLDWKKVVSFYLPRPHSFRVHGRVLFGTAELRGDVLRIRTTEGVVEYPRSELVSIAQGSGSELDWWSLSLGTGMTFRRGNTRQTEIESTGELRRETAVSRFVTSYRGAYANVNRKRTVNNHRVTSDFDLFLTRKLFWKIPFVDYYTDEFQRIDARVTPGSGLGYEFVHSEWVDLEMSVGGAYQFTQLEKGVDEKRTSHDFAVVYTASIETELPGGTDFDNSYRLQLVATDYGATSHHAESLLSLDVWGPLDLDLTFVWDRIQKPARQDDGDKTKQDDFRLLVGFGLDF